MHNPLKTDLEILTNQLKAIADAGNSIEDLALQYGFPEDSACALMSELLGVIHKCIVPEMLIALEKYPQNGQKTDTAI